MGVDIYAAEGNSSEEVTTHQNATASPEATPILEIEADQGQFLRFLNQVAKGDEVGLPVYGDFRDANGDPLPINTTLYWAVKPAGHTNKLSVSEVLRSIDQYHTLTITEQRNTDNIDAVKHTLQAPESTPNGGQPIPHVDVRDIDSLYLMADSPAQIDWAQSKLYVDSNAVKQYGRR